MSVELRTIKANIELRQEGDSDTQKLRGLASPVGETTEICGIGGKYNERFEKGAFDRAIKEGQDVRALLNHDPNFVLGRTKSGTCQLRADKEGLWVEVDPPETQLGRDTVELVKRGDIDGMSIAFIPVVDEFDKESNTRTIKDADLYDVSFVTYPAYTGTSTEYRYSTGTSNYPVPQEEPPQELEEKVSQEQMLQLDLELTELEMES